MAADGDKVVPFKHPGEYIIIKDEQGNIFRYVQNRDIPPGFKEVLEDDWGNSVFDYKGRLNAKYWAIKRFLRA